MEFPNRSGDGGRDVRRTGVLGSFSSLDIDTNHVNIKHLLFAA